MTSFTKNYNLEKPGQDEYYDIDVFNANMEKVDAELTKRAEEGIKLEARIARIEDSLYSNITGNPFSITFGALTNLTITKGIWNVESSRIEC